MTDQLYSAGAPVELGEPEPGSMNGDGPDTAASIDERLARPRRRWPALLVGLAVGAGGALAFGAAQDDTDAAAVEELSEVVTLDTVAVEVRDLIEEVTWAGTLAAGEEVTVDAPLAGTVTSIANVDTRVARGDVIARVDDRPVVVLYGDVPMWRDLDVGVIGDDVRQLEANLSELGFDPEGIITIDDEYTSATRDMVDEWQESLGLEATGEVRVADVVVLAGDASVTSSAPVGTAVQTGETLVTLELEAIGFDVVAAAWTVEPDDDDEVVGELQAVAAPGEPVGHGSVLYTVDGVDAVAVVEQTAETVAVLDAIYADDVELLEEVLVDIGFDPDGAIIVDGELDDETTSAIQRWQESIGLPPTGSAQAAAYVIVPDDREHVAAQPAIEIGEVIDEGRLVMRLESSTLELAADVAVSEIGEFEVGDVVSVEQLDESTFLAVVADIAATTTESAVGSDPTVVVMFEVTEAPEEFFSGSVTITTESSRIDDAIVVPTRALVSLREGGFAVEVADDDGGTTLVGVELGTFTDGIVEIISGDLRVGDRVVVPS